MCEWALNDNGARVCQIDGCKPGPGRPPPAGRTRDLRLTVRDRSAFLWMLVMPLALMWFFGQMGGGGQSAPPQISLSLIDHDGGWLARAFVEELQDEQVNLTEIPPEEAEGTEKVRTLVIPEGFTDKVLAGEQQQLRLEKEPEANEEFSLAAEVHVIRTIVRTLARVIELESLDQLPAVTGDAVLAEEKFRGIGQRPSLVGLDVSTAGLGRPVPRGLAQSVPGMLTMMVLMMTLIYGGVFLTIEKREGMLRRQVSLPVSRAHIFMGKLFGRLMVAGMQIVVLILAARYLFGLSLGTSPAGMAALLICYGVAVAALATMLGSILKTPEQASSIGWMLSMILAAMGGCWWPSEVMPRWLWSAAHVLPTAWAMDAFHALISFGRGLDAVLVPCAALLGFALVFAAVGARYLRPA